MGDTIKKIIMLSAVVAVLILFGDACLVHVVGEIVSDKIKMEEGYRSDVYLCTRGIETIGYGFTGMGLDHITREEADIELERRILIAKADCVSYIGKSTFEALSGAQQLCLIDMAYNLGFNRLNKFIRLKQAIIREDWRSAAVELLDSKYAIQVPNRAKRNVKLITSL